MVKTAVSKNSCLENFFDFHPEISPGNDFEPNNCNRFFEKDDSIARQILHNTQYDVNPIEAAYSGEKTFSKEIFELYLINIFEAFEYCDDNPILNTDPYGRYSDSDAAAIEPQQIPPSYPPSIWFPVAPAIPPLIVLVNDLINNIRDRFKYNEKAKPKVIPREKEKERGLYQVEPHYHYPTNIKRHRRSPGIIARDRPVKASEVITALKSLKINAKTVMKHDYTYYDMEFYFNSAIAWVIKVGPTGLGQANVSISFPPKFTRIIRVDIEVFKGMGNFCGD